MRRRALLSTFTLGLLLVAPTGGVPKPAHADPIIVTYSLSGGTSSGTDSVGDIIGGNAVIRFPNPLSLDRASFTGGSATLLSLTFVGTAGTKIGPLYTRPHQTSDWPNTGFGVLAPTGSLQVNFSYYHGFTNPSSTSYYQRGGAFDFNGQPGGAALMGFYYTNPSFSTSPVETFRVNGVIAQEVPEPGRAPMLSAGALLLVVLARRRRAQRR